MITSGYCCVPHSLFVKEFYFCPSDDDDDDDDEDDEEALLAELERIKKEKAEEKLRQVISTP